MYICHAMNSIGGFRIQSFSGLSKILALRKTVFGISDQVQHKQGCAVAQGGQRFRKKSDGTFYIAKQRRCAFVFDYAKAGFLMTRLFFPQFN